MAHILIMPRQGNTVESCIITGWKIKEGETVTSETAVCEVETDKASFEIPAGDSGVVLKILCNEGDDVPVLSPILVIGAIGENWQTSLSKFDDTHNSESKIKSNDDSKNIQAADNKKLSSSLSSSPALNPQSQVFISPRARSLAFKEALFTDSITGTGPEGRIIERDVKSALCKRPPLTAAAKHTGGNIPAHGSGLAGRITAEDMKPALIDSDSTSIEIKGIRKVIADRMLKSLAESAQFTLNASAPVSKLQEFRSKMKSVQILPEDLNK